MGIVAQYVIQVSRCIPLIRAMVNRTNTSRPRCLGPMTLTLIRDPKISTLRYLIMNCPTESTLDYYVDQFIQLDVWAVARCCQPTYAASRLLELGIDVLDLPFKDGGIPSLDIVRDWLRLVTRLVDHNNEEKTIAVHCVAGLGRAPVLVAIALIELAGMEGLDAVEYVRDRRPGAFNKAQIAYLDSYKPTLRCNKQVQWIHWLGKVFPGGD